MTKGTMHISDVFFYGVEVASRTGIQERITHGCVCWSKAVNKVLNVISFCNHDIPLSQLGDQRGYFRDVLVGGASQHQRLKTISKPLYDGGVGRRITIHQCYPHRDPIVVTAIEICDVHIIQMCQ